MLNEFALFAEGMAQFDEAEPLMRRALAIDEQSFGTEHPRVALRLNNLATLLKATNRLAEAEPLMRRALAIFVASIGPEHPSKRAVTGNYAGLLTAMGRTDTEIAAALESVKSAAP